MASLPDLIGLELIQSGAVLQRADGYDVRGHSQLVMGVVAAIEPQGSAMIG